MRLALNSESSLQAAVQDGLGAVKSAHRDRLADEVRSAFADSLDLDAALRQDHPEENRWDYLLGHAPSGKVIGLEPHAAKQDEITTVIKKRQAAKQQLASHLKSGAHVAKWLWVASGKVHFASTEKAQRRLDEHGIELVPGRVMARHLPESRE